MNKSEAYEVLINEMKSISNMSTIEIDEFIENPKITINGKDIHYNNYDDFKASKYYGFMQAALRMTGGNREWKMAEEYLETRMKEKQDRYSR